MLSIDILLPICCSLQTFSQSDSLAMRRTQIKTNRWKYIHWNWWQINWIDIFFSMCVKVSCSLPTSASNRSIMPAVYLMSFRFMTTVHRNVKQTIWQFSLPFMVIYTFESLFRQITANSSNNWPHYTYTTFIKTEKKIEINFNFKSFFFWCKYFYRMA